MCLFCLPTRTLGIKHVLTLSRFGLPSYDETPSWLVALGAAGTPRLRGFFIEESENSCLETSFLAKPICKNAGRGATQHKEISHMNYNDVYRVLFFHEFKFPLRGVFGLLVMRTAMSL